MAQKDAEWQTKLDETVAAKGHEFNQELEVAMLHKEAEHMEAVEEMARQKDAEHSTQMAALRTTLASEETSPTGRKTAVSSADRRKRQVSFSEEPQQIEEEGEELLKSYPSSVDQKLSGVSFAKRPEQIPAGHVEEENDDEMIKS